MRVLVTGAFGFVGSHVVGALTRAGHEVEEIDLGIPWPEAGADVVISLAATADPKQALEDPAGAYENDVRIMVQTLEYARRVEARVLHVSTNEVYGQGATLPYAPQGPYAGGKACQEIICGSYQDVPTTVVVTQSLFGERQQPDKLVPSVIRGLLDGDTIRLQRDATGWATRPFLHVDNLADALVHMAGNGNGQQRVHVGATKTISVERVAGILSHALRRELKLEAVPSGDRPGHETVVKPIGNDVPGWNPAIDTEHALADTAAWYRDHEEWLR